MQALPATFAEDQKPSHDEFQKDSVPVKTETAVLVQGINVETKHIELLPVHDIRHYTLVPDFQTQSSCSNPIVVNENGTLQCIANWHMVQQALDDGEELIEFLVIIPADPSPEDTALRKLASRVKTLAGKASYPEMLKGYKTTKKFLMNSKRDLVMFAQGGRRRGEQFTGEKENDLYLLLANRLGKSRDSIKKYNYHSMYVSDEVFDILHAEGATKGFFEDIYSGKIKLIQNLVEEELTDEEITEKVSAFVLSEFRSEDSEPEPEGSEEEQVPDNSEETEKSTKDEGVGEPEESEKTSEEKTPEGVEEPEEEKSGAKSEESEETCKEKTPEDTEETAEESEPELPVTLHDYQQEAHESWNEIMPFINIPAEQDVDFEAYYLKLQEHNEKVLALMACVKAQLDRSLSS